MTTRAELLGTVADLPPFPGAAWDRWIALAEPAVYVNLAALPWVVLTLVDLMRRAHIVTRRPAAPRAPRALSG